MKELTGRERLTRIFSGQPIDRIPIWMLFPSKPWHFSANVFDSPSYARVNKLVYEKTDFVGRMHFNRRVFLNAHPDVAEKNEEGGFSIVYKDKKLTSEVWTENGRTVVNPLCKSIEDVETLLDMPFKLDIPDLTAYDEEVAWLGDRGVPCIMMPDPLEFLHHVCDETEFPIMCHLEKVRVKACLDELQRRTVDYYKYFLDRGLGDIYWINGCEYIVPPTLGPRAFGELAVKNDKQLVELVRSYGKKSMIHCHGKIGTLMEHFREIGMDSLHPLEAPPMGDVTLAEARDKLGPDTIFVGNMQHGDLFYGYDEEEICEMTKAVIDESRKGPIIFAVSASPIIEELSDHAERNHIRMIETCLEYGVY